MKRLTLTFIALALLAAGPAFSGVVQLTDGSSVSGELTEQANGDVVVKTGAGEITVTKDKIKTIVKDGSASTGNQGEGNMDYVNKVLERRAKFGNEDGIPRSSLINQNQVAFTLGMFNYVGDGLNFTYGGATYASTSDYSGLHYGLLLSQSFNDISGWEIFTGYSTGEKSATFSTGQAAVRSVVQRADVGYLFRVQKAIPMGAVESNMHLIPHIGLGPVYSYLNFTGFAYDGTNPAATATKHGSAIGATLSLGADLQLGSALIGAKFRYLFSQDVTGGFNSSNFSGMLPQLSIGWQF